MRIRAAALLTIPLSILLTGCPVWTDSEPGTGPGPCVGLGCACFDDSECASPLECIGGRCDLPPGACLDDRDCGADERCSGDTCVPDVDPPTTCRADADCDANERCNADGECEDAPSCDGDCDPGFACDYRGVCVAEDPGACTEHTDCTGNDLCVQDRCRSADDVCQFNYECGPGRACLNGGCTPICVDADDCGSGSSCESGFCRPDYTECTGTSDCGAGEHCVGGRCLDDCRTSGLCASDLDLCDEDEFCRPDWERQPFCTPETVDTDCAPGSVCVEGACRTPCDTGTDRECMETDPILAVCADDMLCYTENETAPECSDERGCDPGDDCVDASCR